MASGWVGRLAAQNRGHASALYLLAYYGGASLLGAGGGWLWRCCGWAGLIAGCGAAMLAVLALGLRLGRSTTPAAS